MAHDRSVTVREHLHPGSGRRVAANVPKGRGVDPLALADIRTLLGEGAGEDGDEASRRTPPARDTLIEALHLIQDRYQQLTGPHLAALAEIFRLPMAEVYETATFYAHFLVAPDAPRPAPSNAPPITVRVCQSVTCSLFGALSLRQEIDQAFGDNAQVRIMPGPCMGWCDRAPTVMVGQHHLDGATTDAVRQCVAEKRTAPLPVRGIPLDQYQADGGYRVLRDCLNGVLNRDDIVARVEHSGLRGLGGAGFRSGQKWKLVRSQPGPRYLAVNADEGEPGTFKDRHHLENEPHRFLEGMLIAAWAMEAQDVYIYLRDEYPHIRLQLEAALTDIRNADLIQGTTVHLRRGAGAYICGEESAMLESLEGKRGYPRHKPPYPSVVGLFGRPTLIHNVETVFWLRDILERGPDWLNAMGRNGRHGQRSFSVSGRIKEPGVKLTHAGITVRELIAEYCGGMADGHTFRAYLPGGASGGILPAHLGDIPLDFGTLEEYGCFIGSAAVIILSQQDCLKTVTRNLMHFFEDESCGQCTPCRIGTEKLVQLLDAPVWDQSLITGLAATMQQASICGLGQAAPNPLLCLLRYFPEEFQS